MENLINPQKTKITEIKSSGNADNLVFKILSEKMNRKYNNSLSNEQKNIIRNYAIYHDDSQVLSDYLSEVKRRTRTSLVQYSKNLQNQVLESKLGDVVKKINELETTDVDDTKIVKFLTLSKLKDEIIRGD